MMRRPLSRRVLHCILLATVGVVTTALSNPGYLAVVGPVSLRFSPVPKPPAKKFVLPAPAPEPVVTPVAPKAQAATPSPAADIVHVASPPSTVTSGLPPGALEMAPIGPSAPEGVVSPQMFLKYFDKPATNAAKVAPLDFSPPKMTAPPASQSSTTYSTSP